jgi:hypothetical protein
MGHESGGSESSPDDQSEEPLEQLPALADLLHDADDRELGAIDRALDEAESTDSRELALAALTRATAGLNSYFGELSAGANSTPFSPVFDEDLVANTYRTYISFLPAHRRHGDEARSNWEERIDKYWGVVSKIVDRYGPDQYQISVGFPQLIAVTLVWNKKP